MRMEVALNKGLVADVGMFFVLASLWGLFVTIFWMVTAWRAMRAHERFAEAIEKHVGMHARHTGETKGVWINPEVIRMAQEKAVEERNPSDEGTLE